MNETETKDAYFTSPSATWANLLTLEPELRMLMVMARNLSKDGTDCPLLEWHDEIKPRLRRLLGPGRRNFHPILSREESYDTAYHALHALVPASCRCRWCRNGD